jgi:hypothetical protein
VASKTPEVLLDKHVVLGNVPTRWALREGTAPVVEVFDLAPKDAAEVVAKGGPLILEIKVGTIAPVMVQHLYCLGYAPSENPHVSRVIVSDWRWAWPYAHVLRRYNVRMRSGTKRAEGIDVPPEADPLLDNITYFPWSLKNPGAGDTGTAARRWRADECLKDVYDAVKTLLTEIAPSAQIRLPELSGLKQVPIEDLQVDDSGDAAIDRVLQYLPSVRVWIDLDGTPVFDQRTGGGDTVMAARIQPEIVGRGHIVQSDNRMLRPKEIRVAFTREIETRFDFTEASGTNTVPVSALARKVDNVLPIPDYSLSVSGQTLYEGTWITFPQAFTAWGNLTGRLGVMTYPLLCRAMVPFMGLWQVLEAELNYTEVNWGPRLAAMQQHFRQTFRINPRWKDRILHLRPYRVATLDRATGARAPAVAYSDYCVIGNQRIFLTDQKAGLSGEYARNYSMYPASGLLDATSRPSPAVVSIVDEDQGIIRLDYLVDPLRLCDMILPSKIEDDARPTGRIDKQRRGFQPYTFDSVVRGTASTHCPRLTLGHKCAIILTAVPAAPNSNAQLQMVTVDPADVQQMVGTTPIGACNGPAWTIRIGANLETARIKWTDSASDVIAKAFGVGNDGADAAEINAELEPHCINLQSNASGAASLRAIAEAAAARIYASLLDRPVGAAAGVLNAIVKPAGWVSEVVHEITPDGAAITQVVIPEHVQQMSMFAFLDPQTRSVVMRQARLS